MPVEVLVRLLVPHHNETSGTLLRPHHIPAEGAILGLQVPYTLPAEDNAASVGSKRSRGADVVLTIQAALSAQQVTLGYLATQLCFEQLRLYRSDTTSNRCGAEREGGETAPDLWSLHGWSSLLRAVCTTPVSRRGSLRPGGTATLRESAYATTKRHAKPSATGVCVFLLNTTPSRAHPLRSMVQHHVEASIGLLGGTVVGSLDLPDAASVPVDHVTHLPLVDVDACVGPRPPTGPSEVVVRGLDVAGLELVDASTWLAASISAGYFVDEGQVDGFKFARQEEGGQVPKTPPRLKEPSPPPPPCTPPPASDRDDDFLADALEATLRKASHIIGGSSPPPSSVTPKTADTRSRTKTPPPTPTTVAEEGTGSPSATSMLPGARKLRMVPEDPPSSKGGRRYIYIVSSVHNAGHLRTEMKKLCSIQRAGLRFLKQGLSSSSTAPATAEDATYAPLEHYVIDDVFYADVVVTNQISKRESVLLAMAGGAQLVTEAFLSACLLERSIQDPTEYTWSEETLQRDAASKNANPRETRVAQRLLRAHLRRPPRCCIFGRFQVAVLLYEANQEGGGSEHSKALGYIVSRGGCVRGMLVGLLPPTAAETSSNASPLCVAAQACAPPSPPPKGCSGIVASCFANDWEQEVSETCVALRGGGPMGLSDLLRRLSPSPTEQRDVVCIAPDGLYKRLTSPNNPQPFGPGITVARSTLLIEVLTASGGGGGGAEASP